MIIRKWVIQIEDFLTLYTVSFSVVVVIDNVVTSQSQKAGNV